MRKYNFLVALAIAAGWPSVSIAQEPSFDDQKASRQTLAFLEKVYDAHQDQDVQKAIDYIRANEVHTAYVKGAKNQPGMRVLRLFGILFKYDDDSTLAMFYRPWEESEEMANSLLSVEDCDVIARKYAGLIAKPEDHVSLFSNIQIQKSKSQDVQYGLNYRIGKYRNSITQWITFSRVDGRLLMFDSFHTFDNIKLASKELVAKRTCENAAMDAYRRYRPYANATLISSDLCIGPIPGTYHYPNELQKDTKGYLDQRIGVPHYQFWIGDADSAYDLNEKGLKPSTAYARSQVIYVEAITGVGTLIEYRASYGASMPTKNKLPQVDFNKEHQLVGSKCRSHLFLAEKCFPLPDKPEGSTVLLSQKGVVQLYVFDRSLNRLWLKRLKGWQAYTASKNLIEAISKRTETQLEAYGSVSKSGVN